MAPRSEPLAGGEPPPLAWQRVETLGVADVVMTILEARKTMPWATAATVSRAGHGDAIHVRVSLLRNSPPEAASGTGEVIGAFAVRQLGEDLASAFGDKDVITLK